MLFYKHRLHYIYMENNIKSSPKDVFMQLLAIGTLYMSVVGFITLLFQYTNVLFPDPLSYENYSSVAGPIRWAMASLIIIFPAYLLLSWALHKDFAVHPEKRELRIRKWLVYFTLFVAAITILSDLVTLVYNFLGGELTARFTIKIFVVLAVAVWVFWYYLRDLRDAWSGKALRTIAWTASIVVLLAIIAGFFTAGSPFKARLVRFDERRVNDLQMLQGEIINYWQRKEKLPAALTDLEDPISGFRVSVDPATAAVYEYRTTDTLKFELCATFNLPSASGISAGAAKPRAIYEPYGANWDHDAGRACFARTIDPQLYPKFEKIRP